MGKEPHSVNSIYKDVRDPKLFIYMALFKRRWEGVLGNKRQARTRLCSETYMPLQLTVITFQINTGKSLKDCEQKNGTDSYIFLEDHIKPRMEDRLEASLEARQLVRNYQQCLKGEKYPGQWKQKEEDR